MMCPVRYVLLTRLPCYSRPESPFRIRLACVRHAASVRSEPGSNSPLDPSPRQAHTRACPWPSLSGRASRTACSLSQRSLAYYTNVSINSLFSLIFYCVFFSYLPGFFCQVFFTITYYFLITYILNMQFCLSWKHKHTFITDPN